MPPELAATALTLMRGILPVLLPITVVHGAGKYPAIAVGLSVAARLVTAAAALAVLFASTFLKALPLESPGRKMMNPQNSPENRTGNYLYPLCVFSL